jgi:hypothetical protein
MMVNAILAVHRKCQKNHVPGQPGQKADTISKITRAKRTEGIVKLVELLTNKKS